MGGGGGGGLMMGMRASKESFSGPMFQSMHESMPQPGRKDSFNTPTAGVEKDESMTMPPPEPISNEVCPNMPPLNPKTNFRYQPD